MTPEQQRIAIAEVLGFRNIHTAENGTALIASWIPDYLNDLNAMHEAVVAFKQTVNDPDRRWSNELMRVIQDHECCGAIEARYRTANATALQRAEAFLRALNLWEEGD